MSATVNGERRIVASSDTVPPEVKFEGRTVTDIWFGVFYVLSYITYLTLGFYIVGNAHPRYEGEGDDRSISSYFLEDAQKCCASDIASGQMCYVLDPDDDDNRRLQAGTSKFDGDEGIFDAFLEAPEIIVGLTAFVLVIAILYGLLLRFFSKPMVFFSELAKVALLITAGVYIQGENAETAAVCYVLAFLSCVYVYWARDKIILTAHLMEHSTIAMKENPTVLAAGLFTKLLYAGNAALFVLFFAESFNNIKVSEETYAGSSYTYCYFETESHVPKMWTYLGLSYLYTVILLDKIRLASIATLVGSWHFHPERKAGIVVALKNTMTSFGTLSLAALIATVADTLNRKASQGWRGWCSPFICFTWPFECLLAAFAICLRTLIMMLTKFAIILHVFTGLGFVGSGKKVFKIMKRHFKGGFVAQVTSQSTLYLFCYAFSFCVALTTWAWLDDRFNANSFPSDGEDYFWILMLIGQLFSIWYPVLGLYLIIFIDQLLKQYANESMKAAAASGEDYEAWNNSYIPPMAAAFVGCISMMFFTFLAKMFLDTLDTLFLCYAIDKDNGIDMTDNEFDSLVKKMPEYIEADLVTEASDPDPEIPVASVVSKNLA